MEAPFECRCGNPAFTHQCKDCAKISEEIQEENSEIKKIDPQEIEDLLSNNCATGVEIVVAGIFSKKLNEIIDRINSLT